VTGSGPLEHQRAQHRGRLEVADIFRAHAPAVTERRGLTPEQRQVMTAIVNCRTAVLGGHADLCPECGQVEVSYNSCRNRHCPKCQGLAQARWIEQRRERVIPTHYFHLVFTLPRELRPLAHRNPGSCFDMLFRAATATLLELGADPKWLGGKLGITAVLHTWTRELHFHPHLHCVVTGGALDDDGAWHAAKDDFLFPVKVLSALFRGKMLDGLRRLGLQGRLDLSSFGEPEHARAAFDQMIANLHQKSWVVYAKRPFGGPEAVFAYLGRYTHRVAISNQRLIAFDDGRVTFHTKGTNRVTIDGETFVERFLLHVLPKGFTKIRHYGLLAPAHATTTLEQAREQLECAARQSALADTAEHRQDIDDQSPCRPWEAEDAGEAALAELTWQELLALLTGLDVRLCPRCGTPTQRVALAVAEGHGRPEELDTS
jgi:hypothetical protein